MILFIDTNVFLAFFHYSGDDLEELKKLVVLLQQRKAELLLPEQVIDEFARNRDTKIAQALKALRDQKLDFRFPEFCKHYPQFGRLRDLQKHYSVLHNELIQGVTEGIERQELLADQTIQALFKNSARLPITSAILDRARLRAQRGNPPGKSDSFGDAINWELLLEQAPEGKDLHFISGDGDFASALDSGAFNSFLRDEWKRVKGSKVHFYGAVSSFFRGHFPEITLATEAEKDLLVRDLINSGSFSTTHTLVKKLRRFTDFSTAQANAIVDAALTNSQIGWIVTDPDVRDLLTYVLGTKGRGIDREKAERLSLALKEKEPSVEIDSPPDQFN